MCAGRLCFKLHSSSYIRHTLCVYVDCHALKAEELSFGLNSELMGCSVCISSHCRPRYHIPPAWRCLLEKRHGEIGGPHTFVTTFLYLQKAHTPAKPYPTLVLCSQTLSWGKKESGSLTYNVLFSVPPGFGG